MRAQRPVHRPGSRRAVTLLELTIVLLVLGLVSAIAAPRFGQSMRGMHSRAIAMQIAAHLSHARRTAINQGRSTTLTFAQTGAGYASTDVEFPGRVGANLQVDLHDTYDQSVGVQADFDGVNNADSLSIMFDLEGVPFVNSTAMQSGLITVSAPGTPTQYIRVAPGTGQIDLYSEDEISQDGTFTEATATTGVGS
jgi:prepilin-type N-terminal cleavage/methylation domain-containing protein